MTKPATWRKRPRRWTLDMPGVGRATVEALRGGGVGYHYSRIDGSGGTGSMAGTMDEAARRVEDRMRGQS